MPTYEYECKTCGYHFEKFQQINEERLKACPQCGADVYRLLGTGAGFIMKGSGSSSTPIRTRCGKDHTCCGKSDPCATPSCAS